jgi:hypothetical protein
MRVMVTANLQTDLDVVNGVRGKIVDIVLEEDEQIQAGESVVTLRLEMAASTYVLDHTKVRTLTGLPAGMIPIAPMLRTYMLTDVAGIKKSTKWQLPITGAYGFTDFRPRDKH